MSGKFWNNKNIQDGAVVTLLGAALGVFSLYSFTHSPVKAAWIMSPYLFPMLIAVFALCLGLCLLFEGKRQAEQGSGEADSQPSVDIRKVAAVVAMSLVYYVLMKFITFVPATVLFVAALMYFMGERRKSVLLAVSVLTAVVIYVIFVFGLNVRLP